MAKKILTLPTYDVNNNQTQPDKPTLGATDFKVLLDKTGTDNKTFQTDTQIPELTTETVDASGAHGIGFGSTQGDITSDNVGDALDEVVTIAKDAQAGTIIPGSITDDMLSNTAGQAKDNISTNANGVNQSLNPIVPDSVVSQALVVTTPSTANAKFTLDIQTTVTGGPITINRDGGGVLSLKNPDGTDVEELSQDTRFFDVIDDTTVFTLAPKGGAKIVIQNVSAPISLTVTNLAITPVSDIEKTYCIVTSYGPSGNASRIRAKLTTTSNVQVNTIATGGTVRIQVIEDSSIKSMIRGSFTYLSGALIRALTVSTYDPLINTLVFSNDEVTFNPAAGSTILSGEKTNTTTVTFNVGVNPTGNKIIDYFLFER